MIFWGRRERTTVTPKHVTWGRMQLEFSDDRLRFKIGGSPWSDAFLFGLLGVGAWCTVCLPLILMHARLGPGVYWIVGMVPLVSVGVGVAVGRRAKRTGFVATRTPPAGISTLTQDGQAVLIPAEDILKFVTKEGKMWAGKRDAPVYSLVAVTRTGEVVLIPEMLTNQKGADLFGRLLSSLLLGHGSFEVQVRKALDVRRRDLIRFGVVFGFLVAVFIGCALFCLRHL
jgi:hypothetical protein